jgi:hypothetical protein
MSNRPHHAPLGHIAVLDNQAFQPDHRTPRRACLQDLPDEILIEIAEQLITAEHQRKRTLVRLTMFCTRLRALFIGTPHLWTFVVFPTHAPEWVALSVSRAKTVPLRAVVIVSEDEEERLDSLFAHTPNVAQLIIRFYTTGAAVTNFWTRIMATELKRIVDLRITSTTSIPLNLSIFSQSRLTSLELMAVTFEAQSSIPALPLLRQLDLSILTWPAGDIRQLLASAPLLERILFFDVIVTGAVQGASIPACTLTHLQDLEIECDGEYVGPLLDMVPNPDHRLLVCAQYPSWSASVTKLNQQVMERIDKFRANATLQISANLTFADAQHDIHILLSEDAPGGRVLGYRLYCIFTEHDAFLDRIKIARLHITYGDWPNLDVLKHLPGIEELHIHETRRRVAAGHNTLSTAENGNTQLLGAWIRTRHQLGRQLKLITVSSEWERTRSWFDSMAAERVAESFVWAGSMPA